MPVSASDEHWGGIAGAGRSLAQHPNGRNHMADDTCHEIDADALAVVEVRTSPRWT